MNYNSTGYLLLQASAKDETEEDWKVTGHNVELLYQSQWRTDTVANLAGSVIMATANSVTMANRHSGEFSWISHNGDGQLSHNGEKEGGEGFGVGVSFNCYFRQYKCEVQKILFQDAFSTYIRVFFKYSYCIYP